MTPAVAQAELLAALDALGIQCAKAVQAIGALTEARTEVCKAMTPEAAMLHTQLLAAEPFRWLAIGRTDLQTGISALRRAITMPTEF